jgi:hypothetical protein
MIISNSCKSGAKRRVCLTTVRHAHLDVPARIITAHNLTRCAPSDGTRRLAVRVAHGCATSLLRQQAKASVRHPEGGEDLSPYECACRNASFFEVSLCLSRACLGKMIVYMYNWRKKPRFPTVILPRPQLDDSCEDVPCHI